MQVKYLDLPRQFSGVNRRPECDALFGAAQFILGPQVEEFEKRFAALHRVPYAVGVGSGTDALIIALKILGIGPGDEVITAPNSFIASAGAAVAVGARPTFADVAADYNIDPRKLEAAITPRTKAIIPVHLTGNPARMDAIMPIARKHNLAVVEDACQAVGASLDGKMVGSFGIGCFSLHPLKNLNVCGDGGMITTASSEVCEAAKLLRNHGLVNRNESAVFGLCSRLDTVQAQIGLFGLDALDGITAARIAHARLYDELLAPLAPHIVLPPRAPDAVQVFHTYVVQAERRDALMAFLADHGVETKIHYPIPIHLHKAAAHLGHKAGSFPVAEEQARRIVTLPVNQYVTDEQVRYVAATIAQFYHC